MKITLYLMFWATLTAFMVGGMASDVGETQPSFTVTYWYVLYTLILLGLPFLLGCEHGKKQDKKGEG
jgi:hypothetical protein